jgi:hypothetical protein
LNIVSPINLLLLYDPIHSIKNRVDDLDEVVLPAIAHLQNHRSTPILAHAWRYPKAIRQNGQLSKWFIVAFERRHLIACQKLWMLIFGHCGHAQCSNNYYG